MWEWLKLETSNLASRLITMGSKEKTAKLGQTGSQRGHEWLESYAAAFYRGCSFLFQDM